LPVSCVGGRAGARSPVAILFCGAPPAQLFPELKHVGPNEALGVFVVGVELDAVSLGEDEVGTTE
jgi:hypothetical protein